MAGTYVIFCSLQECTRTLSTYGAVEIRIFVLRRERKGCTLQEQKMATLNMTWSGVRTYEVDSVSYCISSTELLTRVLLCVTMGDVQGQK